MEFRELLKHRKSVRAYEQRPSPLEMSLTAYWPACAMRPRRASPRATNIWCSIAPDALADFWRLIDDPKDPFSAEMLIELPPVLILPLSNRQAYLRPLLTAR